MHKISTELSINQQFLKLCFITYISDIVSCRIFHTFAKYIKCILHTYNIAANYFLDISVISTVSKQYAGNC